MSELMRGRLGRIRLPSLIQLAESEAVTGWIGVSSGGIALSEGRIVQASCAAWIGLPALMELFLEDEGPFRVEAWDAAPGEPLGDMLSMIMEGCRLMDEWERLASACPRLHHAETALPAPLQASLLNGENTTAMIAAQCAARRTAIIDPLLRLARERLLTVEAVSAPRPSARHHAPGPAQVDYYEAMDHGRGWLLAGDRARAAEAFALALSARPGDRLARMQLARAQARSGDVHETR